MLFRASALTLGSVLTYTLPIFAQTCTTSDCSLSCSAYDGVIDSCGFDYQVWGTRTQCMCKFAGGLQGNENSLTRCVACNQEGLGVNPLSVYQIWDTICATEIATGADAAESLASSASSDVVALFSTSILPDIQSTLCSQSHATPTPTPTPSSSGGGGSTNSGSGTGSSGIGSSGSGSSGSESGSNAGVGVSGASSSSRTSNGVPMQTGQASNRSEESAVKLAAMSALLASALTLLI